MAKNNGNQNAPIVEEAPDLSRFTEEEVLGFPPYLSLSEGTKVAATVVGFDDGDPEFERWVFQASHNVKCNKGAKDEDTGEAETVIVKKGEFFSTSNYAQLRLHQYIGVEILLFVKQKVKLAGGKTMWELGLKLTSEGKAQMNAKRSNAVKEIASPIPAKSLQSAS